MASSQIGEPGPLHDMTAFQAHLLGVIYEHPGAKGLTIKGVLDDLYRTDINHGRLYPNLDHLVEQGLVTKGKVDDRTNSYTITSRGKRELAAHLAWWNKMAGDLLD